MGNCFVRYGLYVYMCSFVVYLYEVLEVVVCSLCLRDFIMRFWFFGVDQIGEFQCILDEEDGNVVVDEILVVFICVEFDGKVVDIMDCIS